MAICLFQVAFEDDGTWAAEELGVGSWYQTLLWVKIREKLLIVDEAKGVFLM